MPTIYRQLGDDALVFDIGQFWVLMLQLSLESYAVSLRLGRIEMRCWTVEANTNQSAVDKAAAQAMDIVSKYQLDVL